jgi:hypothetical protein
MAKDLGNLNLNVSADKKSFGDAGKELGKGAGNQGGGVASGLQGVIGGFSRGGVAGGAQAGMKMAGMLKLAAGVGVAVAGFALLKMSINKVVRSIKSMVKEIESTVHGLSRYNAEMALSAAKSHVRGLQRKMASGERVSGLLAGAMESIENIKDAYQPVKDAWSGIKASAVIMLEPIIVELAGMLKWLTVKILELIIWLQEKGVTPSRVYAKASWLALMISGGLLGSSGMVKAGKGLLFADRPLTEGEKELIKLLEALKKEVQDAKETLHTGELNQYLGQVGVHLSGETWDPWKGNK